MQSKLMLALPTAALTLVIAPAIQADCGLPLVQGSTLNNSLVCAHKPGQAGNPNQRWSEIHNGDGTSVQTLGEHGRGTTDPAGSYDPNIGTWTHGGGTTITYTYTGDGTYDLDLRGTGDTTPEFLCVGSTVNAEIKSVIPIPAASDTNPCDW